MKKLLTLILLVLGTAACEIPFELDGVSERAFYVQYLPEASQRHQFIVGCADPAFGSSTKGHYSLSPSDVTVLVNGTRVAVSTVPELSGGNAYRLEADAFIRSGDVVELSVKGHDGLKDARASTVIPETPVLAGVKLERLRSEEESYDDDEINTDLTPEFKVVLELGREPADGEYYGIKAEKLVTYLVRTGIGDPEAPIFEVTDTLRESTWFVPGTVASLSDLNSLDLDAYANIDYRNGLIGSGSYGAETLTLLTARQLKGGRYEFYIESIDSFMGDLGGGGFNFDFGGGSEEYEYPIEDEPGEDVPGFEPDYWIYEQIGLAFRFELFRLSEEFYGYAKAQYLVGYDMLANFGVSPPNFTYTNVSGGLGVVAGCASVATDWIEVE